MKLAEAIREYHSILLSLWGHQRDEVSKFEEKDYRALFFEMGAGKTWTALADWLQKVLLNKRILQTIIFCPKIMIEGWKREAERLFAAEFSKLIVPLEGSGTQRIKKLKATKDPSIFVTNIEALGMKEFMEVLHKKGIEFCIFDESHKLKDPKGVRSKAAIKLADTCKYKLILSGSPILNDYIDIWSQFRILNKNLLGDNFFKFRLNHFYNANASKTWVSFPAWTIKPESLPKLEALVRENAGVALKKDVMKFLPPIVKKEIYVDLPPSLAKNYKEMEKHFVTEVEGEVMSADIVIVKMLRLQQICCGIVTNDEKETTSIKTGKHEALKELLDDLCPHSKVIVWANFKQCIQDVKDICDEIRLYYTVIEGGQSNAERQEQVDTFNNTKTHSVCIANQQAGGVGVGLQAASYMVYFSKDYRLESDIQSQARAHRGGSEQHQCITRIDLLTKGTIEEDIHQALREKGKLGDIIRGVKDRWR
jgi:SNF2 family DNA or RNA helicase